MGLVDLSANLTDEGTPVVTAHSIEPRGCYCAIRGAMLPAFYSPIVYRCSMEKQKETFELHCKERYGGDNQLGTAPKSKTVTMEKGERIRKVLKNDPAAAYFCAKFKHWVKSRGFQLISYPVRKGLPH